MNISLLEVLTILQALATLGLIGVAIVLWIRVDEIKRIEMILVAHSARMDIIRKQQAERLTEHEQRMAVLVEWESDPTYAAQVEDLNRQIDQAMKK